MRSRLLVAPGDAGSERGQGPGPAVTAARNDNFVVFAAAEGPDGLTDASFIIATGPR